MFGAVDDRLVLDRRDQRAVRAVEHIVAIGRVGVAVGRIDAKARPQLQVARRFEAQRAHAADILQRRRQPLDRAAYRHRQQPVAEIDQIGAQHAVERRRVVAQAQFIGIRLFGLQIVADRIEADLIGRKGAGRGGRREGARHLGEAAEDFRLGAQLYGEAGMGLEPVLHLDLPFGEGRLHDRFGLVADLEALPPQVDRHHAQVDLVLDMILEGVSGEVEFPLGEEGVLRIVAEAQTRVGAAGEGVEAPGLVELVILIPGARAQRLDA